MPQKLHFIKQSQPKFIQQFKERAGLKDPNSIADKIQADDRELDDQSDQEDEKPVIVLPENTSVTEQDIKLVEEGGKMKFRKPTVKRSANQGISASTSSKKSPEPAKRRKKTSKTKASSTSLLSFDQDEDEDL